jgi:hypothetical protein
MLRRTSLAIACIAANQALADGDGGLRVACGTDIEVRAAVYEGEDALAAARVVGGYWSKQPLEQYDLFSDQYKLILRNAFSVQNAIEYQQKRAPGTADLVIKLVRTIEVHAIFPNHFSIVSLVCWEQEGYSGFGSVTFQVSRAESGGPWQIDNIIGW